MPAKTPISEARRLANKLNAQKSTGPKTEAGKARSRANAVKHGLTGAGIALPIEDANKVEQLFLGIQEELAPQTIIGSYLAHTIALMMVRTQRATLQEKAALARQIRHAPAEFDEDRQARTDHLMGWVGAEPVAYRRQLMATPEGCDKLIRGFQDLKAELDKPRIEWDYNHATRMQAYFGRRICDIPAAREIKLSNAIEQKYDGLDPSELEGKTTDQEKVNYACDQLLDCFDAEIARLEAHRATLDPAAIEQDRAEAGQRALFDSGKEATLARKYEAAARREFYRALDVFYRVETTTTPDEAAALLDAASTEPTPAIRAGDTAQPVSPEPRSDRRKPIPASYIEQRLASFEQLSSSSPTRPEYGPESAEPLPFFAIRPPLADQSDQ